MEYFWLNKKNNNKLILIFNGWGMNETPFKHLSCANFDVLILSDYRKFDIDLNIFDFDKYIEKYFIAWSMGVYVSGLYGKILNKFDKKIAVNGTGKIVDDEFGIPEKIYDITVKSLNETSLDKFLKNMFKSGKLNPEINITRDIEGLREELTAIKNLHIENCIDFDKVIISKFDRIIPAKNQQSYWKNKLNKQNTVEISSTHCPFSDYKSFEEIL